MTVPRTMAEYMRELADWLDVADKLIDQVFEAAGETRPDVVPGQADAVQQDLRNVAAWFDAHPGTDQELIEVILNGP